MTGAGMRAGQAMCVERGVWRSVQVGWKVAWSEGKWNKARCCAFCRVDEEGALVQRCNSLVPHVFEKHFCLEEEAAAKVRVHAALAQHNLRHGLLQQLEIVQPASRWTAWRREGERERERERERESARARACVCV